MRKSGNTRIRYKRVPLDRALDSTMKPHEPLVVCPPSRLPTRLSLPNRRLRDHESQPGHHHSLQSQQHTTKIRRFISLRAPSHELQCSCLQKKQKQKQTHSSICKSNVTAGLQKIVSFIVSTHAPPEKAAWPPDCNEIPSTYTSRAPNMLLPWRQTHQSA